MTVRYYGRVWVSVIVILTIAAWHLSYFLINQHASVTFFITHGFLIYDFIYTPIILPFFWWLGTVFDRAKFYADRDPLTSLYNRRYVYNSFPSLAQRSDKNGEQLEIFILDIDKFKEINDTRGHQCGDRVIQTVADTLVKCTQKTDVVARWGGDEFLVILTGSPNEPFSDLLVEHDYIIKSISKRVGFSVSLSIGSCSYPDDATDLDKLIKRADDQMYDIKSAKYQSNLGHCNGNVLK